MKEVIKYYRLFNLLSMDVAEGAVVCSLFFSKIYAVTPAWTSLISLGLTVWIIYTADRLLDVRDAEGKVSSERHRFHKDNQRALTFWLVFIILIDAALLFFMPLTIIKRGALLSVIVIIYILFCRRLHLLKEVFVALLYTAGVVVPVLPERNISLHSTFPLIQFFVIALLNLIIFSWYEREQDLNNKQISLATLQDDRSIGYLVFALVIMSSLLSGYMILWLEMYFVSMVLWMMTMILLMLYRQRNLFEYEDQYRLIGDAVFLLPSIYLLS